MTWEILGAIIGLTALRLAWIVRQPVPKDIPFYILPGMSNLRKLARYDSGFSYVPYGIIWYAINVPIVRTVKYSGRLWMVVLALIDSVFLWYSQILGITVFIAYMIIGTFQLFRAPWNVSINWLIMLAPVSWLFLLLAPVAKLPFGLPIQVWRYTQVAINHQHNYIYYGLLGTLWLIVFNHLYLLPTLDSEVVASLGAIWTLILGYALFDANRKSAKSPS